MKLARNKNSENFIIAKKLSFVKLAPVSQPATGSHTFTQRNIRRVSSYVGTVTPNPNNACTPAMEIVRVFCFTYRGLTQVLPGGKRTTFTNRLPVPAKVLAMFQPANNQAPAWQNATTKRGVITQAMIQPVTRAIHNRTMLATGICRA